MTTDSDITGCSGASSLEKGTPPLPSEARSIRRRVVPLFVGVVLVSASVLKARYLWMRPVTPVQSLIHLAFLESTIFQLTLIAVETVLGLGLLLNVCVHILRRTAVILFVLFLGVNCLHVFAGVHSCACFGMEMQPWLPAGLDLTVILLLWRWRPAYTASKVSLPCLLAIASLPALLVIPLVFRLQHMRSPVEASYNVEFGKVNRGERRELPIKVQNRRFEDVSVVDVECSCPCLEAKGLPWMLRAGEEKEIYLILDLGKEAEFQGFLNVRFQANDQHRQRIFSGIARVQVVPTVGRE
jgi:hypothetical protein